MDRFVARANINNFRDRPRSETDATARSVPYKLLVKEEDKLAKDVGLLGDLAREIVKCQERTRNQQTRITTSERDGCDVTARALLSVPENLIIHQEYHQRVATHLEHFVIDASISGPSISVDGDRSTILRQRSQVGS
jgi:hypothetical protein